jgi:hypothetical protein
MKLKWIFTGLGLVVAAIVIINTFGHDPAFHDFDFRDQLQQKR